MPMPINVMMARGGLPITSRLHWRVAARGLLTVTTLRVEPVRIMSFSMPMMTLYFETNVHGMSAKGIWFFLGALFHKKDVTRS